MSQKVPVLVDAAYLHDHPEARIVDVRFGNKSSSGRQKYLSGHLPGAVYAELESELSHTRRDRGRHPWPETATFARLLSRLGIGPETHVVAVDDGQLGYAGRLWFMLRAFGHEKVSLLDGGLKAWCDAGGPLETGEPAVAPAPLRELKLDASRIAERPEIEAIAEGRSRALLLDARAPERYRGEVEPLDRVPGHIPGAVNAPYAANLRADGRFKAPAELRALYEKLGVSTATEVIASCGSGVTACHDLVALELAGFPPARLYVGSYSEWASDPARPVATGDRIR